MSSYDILIPKVHDIGGGFEVRRLLPSAKRQAVGPFLFFDHFGPVLSQPDDDQDVRPHPHIGLATVTYLFEGEMLHRDSTGVVQRIEPGAINWMVAGNGVVHSERVPTELRDKVRSTHGLQLWVALPPEHEEDAPSFTHTPASHIPVVQLPGVVLRVLVGQAFGHTSPVPAASPTVYLDVSLDPDARLDIPTFAVEQAVYSVSGAFILDEQVIPPHCLVVLSPDRPARIAVSNAARLVIIGGSPLGHRHMLWNFVSSRRERVLQAKEDWISQRFPTIEGETEFVPMPERGR